jgi:predicted GNAT family acetyltransferase
MPELKSLFSAYYQEDFGITNTEQELEQCITEQLVEDEIYLWNDAGIRCMVTAILPFDSGVELTNVFTREEDRKRGYATACTTEVCRTLFQRYGRIVLFVDQHNIAANALYRKIGFQFVDEMNSYTLSGA